MTPTALDDETVALMEETGWSGPRDYLAECVACCSPFWVHPTSGGSARYCGRECRARARYGRCRGRVLARMRAYRARRAAGRAGVAA